MLILQLNTKQDIVKNAGKPVNIDCYTRTNKHYGSQWILISNITKSYFFICEGTNKVSAQTSRGSVNNH